MPTSASRRISTRRISLALRTVSAVVFLAVGAIIAWRRPTDRVALLVALALVTGSTAATAPALADASQPWGVVRDLFEVLPLSCLVVFLFVFPDGRFLPRWSWLLAVVFVATSLVTAFVPGSPLNLRHYPLLDNLVFFGCLGIGAAGQVFRYRRVSDPRELASRPSGWSTGSQPWLSPPWPSTSPTPLRQRSRRPRRSSTPRRAPHPARARHRHAAPSAV